MYQQLASKDDGIAQACRNASGAGDAWSEKLSEKPQLKNQPNGPNRSQGPDRFVCKTSADPNPVPDPSARHAIEAYVRLMNCIQKRSQEIRCLDTNAHARRIDRRSGRVAAHANRDRSIRKGDASRSNHRHGMRYCDAVTRTRPAMR